MCRNLTNWEQKCIPHFIEYPSYFHLFIEYCTSSQSKGVIKSAVLLYVENIYQKYVLVRMYYLPNQLGFLWRIFYAPPQVAPYHVVDIKNLFFLFFNNLNRKPLTIEIIASTIRFWACGHTYTNSSNFLYTASSRTFDARLDYIAIAALAALGITTFVLFS